MTSQTGSLSFKDTELGEQGWAGGVGVKREMGSRKENIKV